METRTEGHWKGQGCVGGGCVPEQPQRGERLWVCGSRQRWRFGPEQQTGPWEHICPKPPPPSFLASRLDGSVLHCSPPSDPTPALTRLPNCCVLT